MHVPKTERGPMLRSVRMLAHTGQRAPHSSFFGNSVSSRRSPLRMTSPSWEKEMSLEGVEAFPAIKTSVHPDSHWPSHCQSP